MYGMDSDGDGVVNFAELQAYEKHKQDMIAQAAQSKAAAEAAKAGAKAEMASQYDTVPGFAARRGWHGNDVNHHNYADHLDEHEAVFPYRCLPPGPMAAMLQKNATTTTGVPMEPRGRARTNGGGGVEGPSSFYEQDRLAGQ